MTREEAIDIETIDEAINNINKIYDDIESRTCSNCRWLFFKSETQPDGLGWEERDCEANDSFIWKEPLDKWGCSNFERLEND